MARTKKTAATAETTATTPETASAPRRFFRIKNVGTSDGSKAYAYHLEGTLTRDLNILPATGDKQTLANGSIGIGTDVNGAPVDAKGLYYRAIHADKPDEEPTPFVNLVFRGKLAEKAASELKKGELIAVSGPLQLHTGKDGVERTEVLVDNYVVLRHGNRNKRVSVSPMSYTKKDGETVTTTEVTLLTGKVLNSINTGESKTTGKPWLRCGIGLAVPAKKVFDLASTGKVGDYPDDAGTIMNLVFFDRQADTMQKLLKPGMVIAVTGQVTEDVYNGNTSYVMRPRSVSVVSYGDDQQGQTTSAPAADETSAEEPAAGFADLGDEGDEELPF